MGSEVNCVNENLDSSGGLEELYTDFDGWITKRSWKFRQRTIRPTHERIPEIEAQNRTDNSAKTIIIDYQDCFVNGFSNRQVRSDNIPKDVRGLARSFKDGEELAFLDFVIVRLVRENGRRRILFVNRSKL